MKIGYLGPTGTFSHEACIHYNTNAKTIPYKTISDTIIALVNSEIDEAIVPIENSIQGGVTETIDTFIKYENIFVKKELLLKITHNLIANNNYKLSDLKEIYSHPQALAQCRNFINNNLNHVIINQVSSTALAAKEIKTKDYCACIANKVCVNEYNLTSLYEQIQDNSENYTKFWILSKLPNTSGNKMSIVFSTENKPGELFNVLGVFNKYNINLSKIESRPAKTILGEYIFLIDININKNIDQAIDILKQKCSYIRILGIY